MSNAMAIMANRNKIVYFSIFSIAIDMMYYQYSFVFATAVITFFFVCLPGVLSVTSGHLRFYRFIIPAFNLTFFTAKLSTCWTIFYSGGNNIKTIDAFLAHPCRAIFMRRRSAYFRAKFLFNAMMFFTYKFSSAGLTFINNRLFFFIYSSAFGTTGFISGAMTKRNSKYLFTNRTLFSYFFHKGILT